MSDQNIYRSFLQYWFFELKSWHQLIFKRIQTQN